MAHQEPIFNSQSSIFNSQFSIVTLIRWSLIFLLTVGLLAGSWYLYTTQPLAERANVVVPSDEILPEVMPLNPETILKRDVTLFIGDPNTGALVHRIGRIDANLSGSDAMRETVRQLLNPGADGGANAEASANATVRNYAIPEGTELISLFMTNTGIVYLNLNRNLQDRHIGGMAAELTTVTALVNTLLFNFREVRQVLILVEGAEIETLAGHIDCRKPFSKMLLAQNL